MKDSIVTRWNNRATNERQHCNNETTGLQMKDSIVTRWNNRVVIKYIRSEHWLKYIGHIIQCFRMRKLPLQAHLKEPIFGLNGGLQVNQHILSSHKDGRRIQPSLYIIQMCLDCRNPVWWRRPWTKQISIHKNVYLVKTTPMQWVWDEIERDSARSL